MTSGLVLTTLRLHRAQIVVTAAFLAVLVVTAWVHGSATAAMIADYRTGRCAPLGCAALAAEVQQRQRVVSVMVGYLGVLPAAVGAFWGAPLVGREFETGSITFAWTQSTTRRSWILSRIVTLGLLVAVGGLVVGVVVGQSLSVFGGMDLPGDASDTFFPQLRGTGPLVWWLFAFATGTASGALLRRTVPAMAITVAVVVAATIARNLLFAGPSVGTAPDAAQRLGEAGVLIAIALVLATTATWVVVRARA